MGEYQVELCFGGKLICRPNLPVEKSVHAIACNLCWALYRYADMAHKFKYKQNYANTLTSLQISSVRHILRVLFFHSWFLAGGSGGVCSGGTAWHWVWGENNNAFKVALSSFLDMNMKWLSIADTQTVCWPLLQLFHAHSLNRSLACDLCICQSNMVILTRTIKNNIK